MTGNTKVPWEEQMLVRRRELLAGAAAIAVTPQAARAQTKPRVTFISQWSSGSDGAAISDPDLQEAVETAVNKLL